MNIELNKTYRTRSGQKCRIICVDAKGDRPILGLIENKRGGESVIALHELGVETPDNPSPYDLISEWTDPLEYDRSLLPAWCNKAIAMDADGQWNCYEEIPNVGLDENQWSSDGNFNIIPDSHAPKWKGDWRDSLLTFED